MALAVAIVEPVQVGAVPLAALALVATLLMPALAHLPLEGAGGRLVALQDLDGAMVTLLDSPPLQFGLDPHPQPLQLLRRSEEHTSELQSRQYLVCRLL